MALRLDKSLRNKFFSSYLELQPVSFLSMLDTKLYLRLSSFFNQKFFFLFLNKKKLTLWELIRSTSPKRF